MKAKTKKSKVQTTPNDREGKQGKGEESSRSLTDYLVLADWDVPLCTPEELRITDKGITYVSQKVGEAIFIFGT